MSTLADRVSLETITNRRQHLGLTVGKLCQKAGISQSSYYKLMKGDIAGSEIKSALVYALGIQDGDIEVTHDGQKLLVSHPADHNVNGHDPLAVRKEISGLDPGAEITISMPRGLSQFAEDQGISYRHVLFLERLDRALQEVHIQKGRTIDTPEEWRKVYEVLTPYL